MRILPAESDERGRSLTAEIATFERNRERLQEKHPDDHWVVVQGSELIGVYRTFEEGHAAAMAHCGAEPFLLRQVKPEPMMLPGSLLLHESCA